MVGRLKCTEIFRRVVLTDSVFDARSDLGMGEVGNVFVEVLDLNF